ncbi:MAG: c-type cytochrome [Pseudomonadota bacterium]
MSRCVTSGPGLLIGAALLGLQTVAVDAACDLDRGTAVLAQCKVCHSVASGAPHSTGPNLFGIVGRQAAVMDGFAYSKVLRESGFTWDPQTLDHFLANPQQVLPYNRMAFGGVTDDADRAAVICALQDLK